jgi:hypothetical protein
MDGSESLFVRRHKVDVARTGRSHGSNLCRTAIVVTVAAGPIVWKPCVFSPHEGEKPNGDSVPVISCPGTKNWSLPSPRAADRLQGVQLQ